MIFAWGKCVKKGELERIDIEDDKIGRASIPSHLFLSFLLNWFILIFFMEMILLEEERGLEVEGSFYGWLA